MTKTATTKVAPKKVKTTKPAAAPTTVELNLKGLMANDDSDNIADLFGITEARFEELVFQAAKAVGAVAAEGMKENKSITTVSANMIKSVESIEVKTKAEMVYVAHFAIRAISLYVDKLSSPNPMEMLARMMSSME
jgi:hypothetical protein